MIENPFIIAEKVIPKYFCDRKNESESMIKLLRNGNNIVLISQRRVGKTGLIQYCFQNESISDNFITVYIDILSTTNLQEFTYLLGREVFDSIRTRGEMLWQSFLTVVKSLAGKIGFDPMSGLPVLNLQLGDIAQPEYTLKEIFQYLSKSKKPCLIAIDEFQQISNYPEKNVEALLRSHLLQINNCRMIFSGSEQHLLSEIFVSSSRPFYQSASIIELNVIPKDIYVEFIEKMFREGRKRISKELALKIYELFDGITFYVQRVCNGVYANTAVKGEADEEILDQTIEDILASYDMIYRIKLSQLTTRQKELLIAIAAEGKVEGITSMDFIKRYSLASPSTVQTSIKSLIKNDLVLKSGKIYQIGDRFFRLWIKKIY